MTYTIPPRHTPEIKPPIGTDEGDEQEDAVDVDAESRAAASRRLFFVSMEVPPPQVPPPAGGARPGDQPPVPAATDKPPVPAASDKLTIKWEQVERDPLKYKSYIMVREAIMDLAGALSAELHSGKEETDFKTKATSILESPETSAAMRDLLKKAVELPPGEERTKLMTQVAAQAGTEKLRKEIEQLVASEQNRQPMLSTLAAFQSGMEIEARLKDYFESTDPEKKQAAWTKLVNALANDKSGLSKRLLADSDPRLAELLKQPAMPIGGAGGDKDRQLLRTFLDRVQERVYESTQELYPLAARFVLVSSVISAAQFKSMQIGESPDFKSPDRFTEGCVFPRPLQDGQPMEWNLFITKMATGDLTSNLSKNWQDVLTASGASKFEDAVRWVHRSQAFIMGEERKRDAAECWQHLQKFGVPKDWAPPDGKDPSALDAWLNAANRIRNELTVLREYVQAYLTLKEIVPEKRDLAISDLKRQGFIIDWDEKSQTLVRFQPPGLKSMKVLSPEVEQTLASWAATRKELAQPVDKVWETMARGETAFFRHGVFPGDKGFILHKDGKPTYVTSAKLDNLGNVVDPGKIVTYIRRAGGKEEVIDINREGRFITAEGADVTSEVAGVDPTKFADADRTAFDYIDHGVSSKTVPGSKVELTSSRRYMKDKDYNYHYMFGKELFSLQKTVTEDAKKYVPVVSSSTGRLKFIRADEVSGVLSWKAGQIVGDTLSAGAGIVTDAAMLYAGGAGLLRGVATRAWGTAAIGALRFSIASMNIASGALRQTERGREALKYTHWAAVADVSINGLGRSAVNLLMRRASAAESTLLLDRVAHAGMAAGGIMSAPSLYNSISYRLEKRRNATPAELAEASKQRGVSVTSEQFDQLYRPFDLSKPERHRDFTQMLKTQESLLAMSADKESAARIQRIFDRTRDALTKPIDAAQLQDLKGELARLARRTSDKQKGVTQAEVLAAVSCLIYLNTDATGKVNPELYQNGSIKFSYRQAVDILEKGLGESASGFAQQIRVMAKHGPDAAILKMKQLGIDGETAARFARELAQPGSEQAAVKALTLAAQQLIEPMRLQCADMLFALGKLSTRKMAAVCSDILENRQLPDALRQRALFDGGRPRLALLLNDLQAEEQQALTDVQRQAFLGTIHGYRSTDILKLVGEITGRDGEKGESADLRAACALAMQVMQSGDSEKRLLQARTFADKVEELKAKPGAVASWTIEQLQAQARTEPLKGDLPADKQREAVEQKLQAVSLLKALGKVDGKDLLTPEQYNRHLLDCLCVLKGTTIAQDVIRALDIESLATADRMALIKLLSRSTTGQRSDTNDETAAAKLALLQRLPELIAGDDTQAMQLRLAARELLQANLKPPLLDVNRVALRAELYTAMGACGFDDAESLQLIQSALKRDDKGNWNEPSSYVRRAAIEALYKLSPADAARIAAENLKTESESTLARRYEQIVKEQQVRLGIGPGEEEVKQQLMCKLLAPQYCLRDDGVKLLQTSRFSHLDHSKIVDFYRAAYQKYDKEKGPSFRVAKFFGEKGFEDPDKLVRAFAQHDTEDKFNDAADVLCKDALSKDEKRARAAILAIAHLLDTECKGCWKGSESLLQCKFTATLAKLCEKPHPNRDLVFTLIKGYLEQKSTMDARARWNLYMGFRHLANSGALDQRQQLDIVRGTLTCPLNEQTVPNDPDCKKFCVDLLKECFTDLERLRPRDAASLGALAAIAKMSGAKGGLWAEPQFAALAESAATLHHRISRSTWPAFLQYKDNGTVAPPAELADKLSKAFFDYQMIAESGGGKLDEEQKLAERDKLIDLIFKCTEGTRIKTADDPRVQLLCSMGYGADDPLIAEACAVALMRAQHGHVSLRGHILLASIDTTNNPGLQKDVDRELASLRGLLKEARKRKTPGQPEGVYDAQVDGDMQRFKEFSQSKRAGALAIIQVAREVTPRAEYNATKMARQAREWSELLGKKQTERLAWSIAASMAACPLVKDDVRLPALREILRGDCSDKIALAICLHMAYDPKVASAEDLSMVEKQLERLTKTSTDPTIVGEATVRLKKLR